MLFRSHVISDSCYFRHILFFTWHCQSNVTNCNGTCLGTCRHYLLAQVFFVQIFCWRHVQLLPFCLVPLGWEAKFHTHKGYCLCACVCVSAQCNGRTHAWRQVKVFCGFSFILRIGVDEIPVVVGHDTVSCVVVTGSGNCLVLLQWPDRLLLFLLQWQPVVLTDCCCFCCVDKLLLFLLCWQTAVVSVVLTDCCCFCCADRLLLFLLQWQPVVLTYWCCFCCADRLLLFLLCWETAVVCAAVTACCADILMLFLLCWQTTVVSFH